MKTHLGIIGGSGIYNLENLNKFEWKTIKTPYGFPSDQILNGKINNVEISFLPRHGRGHVFLLQLYLLKQIFLH